MKIGTKSVLFGVHQFLFHPLTVALSWRQLYSKWPCWWEWVAIVTHDLGYIGCPEMDGPIGRQHPVKGAHYAEVLTRWIAATYVVCRHPVRMAMDLSFQMQAMMAISDTAEASRDLALGHSRFYAQAAGRDVSELFRPDKLCVRFDPAWFYILRATLSGEIWEYMMNAPDEATEGADICTVRQCWYAWYRAKVEKKFA